MMIMTIKPDMFVLTKWCIKQSQIALCLGFFGHVHRQAERHSEVLWPWLLFGKQNIDILRGNGKVYLFEKGDFPCLRS